jgi:S-formylglutathione hydrolase FrmB
MIETFYVHSPSMDRDIRACVVLPPEYAAHPEKSYPILYTLHGSDAPFDAFARMIPLRKALKDKPMLVACFDGDGTSNYIDSPLLVKTRRPYGPQEPVKSLFNTFFFKEFIPTIDQRYRVDTKKRMLTGFSMGSLGAFQYMLNAPHEFIAVSSMSGWFPVLSQGPTKEDQPWFEPLLGPYAQNRRAYQDFDIHTIISKQIAAATKLPPIYMTAGTEDPYIAEDREMRDFLRKLGVSVDYHEDKGHHDWIFWRDHSALLIDFHWKVLQQQG